MPARAAGDQHEDRRPASANLKRSRTRSRIWCWNSEARFRASMATAWCAVRSSRRCSATRFTKRFREIKRTFDPEGIFNPGKIVDAPPLTSNLRFGAKYAARESAKHFSIFPNTAESPARWKCAAASARAARSSPATMCPSYMATREESDSTRGRANVLRLAISGKLNEAGLGDDGVFQVLDLCLECRACKTECPVGVDMARFKSEFLADYYSRHGTPLQARVLGNIDRLVELGKPLRAAFEPGLPAPFIDRRRKLPPWKRETFARWAAKHASRVRQERHAVQRHVHQSLRARNRRGRSRNSGTRRMRGECRPAGMLRTPAHLARLAGSGDERPRRN